MGSPSHIVEPGGLSPADHERIFELAERGWKAPRIALSLRKDTGTVQWFMCRNGLADAPKYCDRKPYMRNGQMITAYDREEDEFILALRVDGVGFSEIARQTNAKFGRNRSMHGVNVRLVRLAAREDA